MIRNTLKKMVSLILCMAAVLAFFTFPSSALTLIWDGKTELTEKAVYTVDREVIVTKNFTLPEGAVIHVKEGGSLIMSRGAVLRIYGELAVSIGGTLEVRSGKLNVSDGAKLSIYGELLHYMEAEININKASFNIYNRGNYKGSGYLNIYPNSYLTNKGYMVMTRSSVSVITGSAENLKNAEMHLQGAFKITTSGSLINNGYMTVGKNGEIRNSGKFTIEKKSGFTRFGSVVNTVSGVYNDKREEFDYEKMTVSTLVDEEQVITYGVDVSYSQGDIDWEKVGKSGADFVIIRAARSGVSETNPRKADDYFRQNIEGALANGLEVGVYFYSYATTEAECRADAEFLVDLIRDYRVTYPIALDMEEDMGDYSVAKITGMIEAFFSVIMEEGYFPMLYSYKSWLETYLDMTILDKYAIWLAQLGEVTYEGGYYIWQYSHTGKVSGIKGNVDLNKAYRDFPEIFGKNGLNNLR